MDEQIKFIPNFIATPEPTYPLIYQYMMGWMGEQPVGVSGPGFGYAYQQCISHIPGSPSPNYVEQPSIPVHPIGDGVMVNGEVIPFTPQSITFCSIGDGIVPDAFNGYNAVVEILVLDTFLDKLAGDGQRADADRITARTKVLEQEFSRRLAILAYVVCVLEGDGWTVSRRGTGLVAAHPQYKSEAAVAERLQQLELRFPQLGLSVGSIADKTLP